MSEVFITIALVCLVFSALWVLVRRAKQGCYPEQPLSLHTPVPSMDVAAQPSSPVAPVQQRLDASLKQALRSMSYESLRDFSPEAGDTQAKRMRRLELDRRSRVARRKRREETAEAVSKLVFDFGADESGRDSNGSPVADMDQCKASREKGLEPLLPTLEQWDRRNREIETGDGLFDPLPPISPAFLDVKKALRDMSDEELKIVRFTVTDKEARRMRKLELDRRSRNKRRHARAARKAFESIQNGCKDSILSKVERDSLMPQGWDANGSPT